ncbi:MAG: MYXO-CTERM sorting domain-containing protein [Akkermansia sp.]|nr:MYXO-CTERM sorting domain-containing protein [Akkermansia sp.]
MNNTIASIIILVAAAAAAAGEAITLSSNLTIGRSDAGNGYSGISFALRSGSDRYFYTGGGLEDGYDYSLTGIAIQWRNDNGGTKIGSGVYMAVTDADRRVLGISRNTYVGGFEKLPGTGEEKFAVVHNNFTQPVTLLPDTVYRAYYVTEENLTRVKVGAEFDLQLAGSVNLMVWGGFGTYHGPHPDWGLLLGDNMTAQEFEPVGYLTIDKSRPQAAPEPAGGVLALVGLGAGAMRRRRR